MVYWPGKDRSSTLVPKGVPEGEVECYFDVVLIGFNSKEIDQILWSRGILTFDYYNSSSVRTIQAFLSDWCANKTYIVCLSLSLSLSLSLTHTHSLSLSPLSPSQDWFVWNLAPVCRWFVLKSRDTQKQMTQYSFALSIRVCVCVFVSIVYKFEGEEKEYWDGS